MKATPLGSSERILLLDAIRGVALCGILILNIYFFALPIASSFNLRAYHETGFGNVSFWYITNFLAEGSFRALFSMLFGAGCILLVSRLEQKNGGLQPADVYFTRITWLLIFGMVNTFVILWQGDILFAYAACGLLIFPFRKSSPRLLIFMALFCMAAFMFKSWNRERSLLDIKAKAEIAMSLEKEKKTLTEEQKEDIKKFKDKIDDNSPKSLRKKANKEKEAIQTKTYPELFVHLLEDNMDWESVMLYRHLFFDVMIFIFFGMAFFKMGILTGEQPGWVYACFVVLGYGIGLSIGYLDGHAWREAHYRFYDYYKIKPFAIDLYQIRRLLVGMANLGVVVLLYKSGWFKWLLKPFAAVGQMAFSNYLGQSIICTIFFYGYGFGYYGNLQRYELWYVVVSVWVFQIIFSVVWLRFFRFGPLEWIWRSLTYWELQSIRKV